MTPGRYRPSHAWTLIELLVVVAVLGILAMLILPAIRNMRDRAKSVNCAANLRHFGSVCLLFRVEHNGYFPPGRLLPPAYTGGGLPNSNPMAGVNIIDDLIKGGYLEENDLPYCPSMRLSPTGVENLKAGQTAQSIFKQIGSYALNLNLMQTKLETLSVRHSQIVLAAESYFTGVTNHPSHQTTTLRGMDYGIGYNQAPRSHGSNRLNFMFLDGHIALLAPKTLADGAYVWAVRNNADLNDPAIPFDVQGRNGKYIPQMSKFETRAPQ